MRKTKAIKLPPGTLVYFKDHPRGYCHDDRLGRIEHVTARGGVLLTPVAERYGDIKTIEDVGPAKWVPYSRIQLANT